MWEETATLLSLWINNVGTFNDCNIGLYKYIKNTGLGSAIISWFIRVSARGVHQNDGRDSGAQLPSSLLMQT